jgi:hypothetical protein
VLHLQKAAARCIHHPEAASRRFPPPKPSMAAPAHEHCRILKQPLLITSCVTSNDDHAGLLHCKDCASVRHGDELKPTRRASAHARCRPPATSIDERWCHQQVFTAIHDGDRHVQRPVTAVCNVVTLVPKNGTVCSGRCFAPIGRCCRRSWFCQVILSGVVLLQRPSGTEMECILHRGRFAVQTRRGSIRHVH